MSSFQKIAPGILGVDRREGLDGRDTAVFRDGGGLAGAGLLQGLLMGIRRFVVEQTAHRVRSLAALACKRVRGKRPVFQPRTDGEIRKELETDTELVRTVRQKRTGDGVEGEAKDVGLPHTEADRCGAGAIEPLHALGQGRAVWIPAGALEHEHRQ